MVPARLRNAGSIIWRTVTAFIDDSCPQMAAALSYYTVFSLPPLLLLLIMLVGTVVEPAAMRETLTGQIGDIIGDEGALQVEQLLENASRPEFGGWAALLGVVGFLFGATGAFAQLQVALNRAWRVAPDPTRGGLKNFVFKRMMSFAMILAVGFLLLVSMVISTVIVAFGDLASYLLGTRITEQVLLLTNLGVSFTVSAMLFAAMFRFVPDAVVRWRDAIVGGVFTSVIFSLGRFGLSFWLGQSDPGSAFGAAGSLAVVLLWVYFSSLILLLGAEFTKVWAESRGDPIIPEPGAARIVQTRERLPLSADKVLILLVAGLLASVTPSPAIAQEAMDEEAPRVESIVFRGVDALSTSTLRESIMTEERRCKSILFAPFCWVSDSGTFVIRPRLDRTELARDELRIRVVYWRAGFRQANATARIEPDSDGVRIVFDVEEGEPTILSSLDVVQTIPVLNDAMVRRAAPPETGRPLDMERLDSARIRLRNSLWQEGYTDGEVRDTVVLSDAGLSAAVSILIEPGPRSTVEDVIVTGNVGVSSEAIQLIVGLNEGNIFRRGDVVDAQRRLYASELFRQALVQVPEPQDSSKRVIVSVQEAPFRAVEAGVGLNTIEFGQARVRLAHYHWMGGARRVTLDGAVGNLLAPQLYGRSVFGSAVPRGVIGEVPGVYLRPTWRASAEISQPWLFSTRNALSVGAFVQRRSVPGIVVDRGYGGNATVTRSLARRVSASLGYRYERTRVEAGDLYFCVNFGVCRIALVEALQSPQSMSPASLSILAERADDPLQPTTGWNADLTLEHASEYTLSDFRYHRLNGEATRYQSFGPGVLAGRLRFAWVRGLGATGGLDEEGLGNILVHPRKRVYSGGSRTVRGYGENQLGPRILTIDPDRLISPEDRTRGEACSIATISDGSCDPAIAPSDDFLPRPLGGSSLVGASIEYRYNFGESLVAALFVDAARVGDLNLNDPPGGAAAITPGFGVRYRSPIGPVRIDLGIRPTIDEDLPVVTQIAGENGELRLVQLGRTKRYSPVETGGSFFQSAVSRLQLHLSIGEAF